MTIFTERLSGGTCKGCGQEIVWAYTWPNVKAHPLNPSFKMTNVRTIRDPMQAETSRIGDVSIEQSHFATCPRSEDFRKKGEGSSGSRKRRQRASKDKQGGLFE